MDIKKAFSTNPIDSLTGALSGATGGLSGFVGKLGALSALAAGGFGLSNLISGAVAGGESIYQLSTKMGISAAEAASLNKVLKLTGGDTQSFAAAMTKLDKSYSSSGEAGDKTRGVLDAFGVTLTDNEGKLLPLNQQLAALSKGYKLAAQNGIEQEYIMSTLGVKGLSLVQTLKDYDEASTNAAKTKGVGIDPKQMHELDQQMKILSMQAGSVGSAFAGALAPIAQEIFPPIMTGLSSTAGFLAENKRIIGSTVVTLVELTAAYKLFGAVTAIITGLGTAWSIAEAKALASLTTTATATTSLSLAQERSISRMIAVSNREYAKYEATAVKAAIKIAGSAEAASTVIVEGSARISAAVTIAAENIRTKMTAAFALQAEAATASAVIVSEAFAAEGAAATGAGVKAVAAAEASNLAAASSVVVQGEVAAAHILAGNAAVLQGERTVGAMAVSKMAVGGMLSSLWALAGGWIGVAIATGYAISKLIDYMDTKWQVESYNPKTQVYDDQSRLGMHTKKVTVDNIVSPDDPNEFGFGGSDGIGYSSRGGATEVRVPLSEAEETDHSNWAAWKEKQANQRPWESNNDPDLLAKFQSALAGSDPKEKKSGKSDADKEAKAYEKLQEQAIRTSQSIKDEWISLTGTQLDALDNWKSKELESLEESKSANVSYDNDLMRLDQIYAEKKKKILYDQQKDANSIWDKALSDARDYQDRTAKIGMLDGNKQVFEIKSNAADELIKIQNAARDAEQAFSELSNESKLQTIQALTAAGTQFTVAKDGMIMDAKELAEQINANNANMSNTSISLAQDTANKTVIINQEMAEKLKAINQQILDHKNALDKAHNIGDLPAYIAELNSERGALSLDLAGRQEMIDAYYSNWKETHRTSMSYMAEGMSALSSGMASVYKDIIKGVDGAKSAWVGFRDTVIDIIADIVSKQMAANLTSGIMGLFGGGFGGSNVGQFTNNSNQVLSGPVRSNGKFAGGGQIFGAGTGTSDSILAMVSNGEYVIQDSAVKQFGSGFFDMLNAGKMPAFATGGIVTGSPLSSMGRTYNNATVSTNRSTSESPNMRVVINNYGNANVQTEKPQFDEKSKSWVLNVMVDGLKNNNAVRSAAKGAVK